MSSAVLIVDDDRFIRRLIATTLEDATRLELHEAGDGLVAYRRVVIDDCAGRAGQQDQEHPESRDLSAGQTGRKKCFAGRRRLCPAIAGCYLSRL